MPGPAAALNRFADEASRLASSASSTEESYYPALKELLSELLKGRGLPFEVRAGTSERRSGRSGKDFPDLALYDGGEFVAVFGEVKPPRDEIRELATSTANGNQIGRYLAQTGVVLLSTVRSFALLACRSSYERDPKSPVPPAQREILEIVDVWPSESALLKGKAVQPKTANELGDLLERAVTEFAPIADPASLARILALQARRAKADLPQKFDAVQGLLSDYRVALGLTFNDREGAEFFRSSLIQTAFYGLFAGWTVWHRMKDGRPFEWDRMDRYLKIPFLGKLFYEFKHPDRLAELRLAPHLDRATATLLRVDRSAFFSRFTYGATGAEKGPAESVAAAITYFYEPFLEAFDHGLRKELGVWYTPPDIVRYQVRRIDRLLRERLDCPLGFADDRVVVLDPCCGTGAYLLEVIRCVREEMRARGDEAIVATTILEAVSRRIVGFEILTAPFVVAQLQIYLMLADMGVEASPRRRPAVFLTNALTGWEGPEQVKLNFPELQEEHDSARQVKQEARVIVILGNPPYNRFVGAAIAEEADLVDHYKGIRRRAKKDRKGNPVVGPDGSPVLVQDGESLLFGKWGIQKQLLDDYYIRFFRLAEKRIGERAEYGVVSFISNSSYLAGRSHPLMRESLLKNFHEIWIDNTHGNRLASERTPWGDSCETLFSLESGPGIKVGTAISTFLKLKKPSTGAQQGTVFYRDFWGRADLKRKALVASLSLDSWKTKELKDATGHPEGPRQYEELHPSKATRYMFAPREFVAGYEGWPALDELFPASYQGVNPNRGLEGSLVDVDRDALSKRMQEYFESTDFEALREKSPALFEERARYDPRKVWERLRLAAHFDGERVVPYLVFPLDLRWLYYETDGKLLNERRPEFWDNLVGNEFLVTVPQPRRPSESRPLLAASLVDLHLHDRGSVCFPREVKEGSLLLSERANLADSVWGALKSAWGLAGSLSGKDARRITEKLFRTALATLHAPRFEEDHRDSLAQDWAHLPIPKDSAAFDEVSRAGEIVARLLDPTEDPSSLINDILPKEYVKSLGVLRKLGSGAIREEDLAVRISYYGPASGRWVEREPFGNEILVQDGGSPTGDLYVNAEVYFSNVPRPVWAYELGGYPVLKKWLGYRHEDRREGRPLSLSEARHFRSMVLRIAALQALHFRLDQVYEAASGEAFTAEELGLRSKGNIIRTPDLRVSGKAPTTGEE